MSAQIIDPANVPLPTDVRWELARREPATHRQMVALRELSEWEDISLPDLFGAGYTPDALSKWAAHWGIEVLESRIEARAVEEAERAVQERREQQFKAWAANYFRAQHPGKFPHYTRMEF